MPDLLPPEACVDFLETIAADPSVSEEAFDHMARRRAFELRNHRPAGATQHYQWFRVAAPIGDDPLIHRAFLAFPSAMGLPTSARPPHGLTWSPPGPFPTNHAHT